MKRHLMKLIIILSAANILIMSLAYAEMPNPNQNGGSDNISYDLASKFYTGFSVGYSIFGDDTVKVFHKNATLEANSMALALFGGYKFNHFISLETNFHYLGKLTDDSHTALLPLAYKANVYNVSLDGLLSFPIISEYYYTASIYGKAGYGINFTNYSFAINNGITNETIEASGNLAKGAYNAGLGINVDLRSNISTRLDYTVYQAHYPLPGNGNSHNANFFSLGVYYNFS